MYILKNLIKAITIFHLKEKEKDILLFSTPRSGSTWLLELIISHSKGKSIGEPFNLRRPLVQKYLKASNWEYLNKIENINEISRYLQNISNGNLSFNNPPIFSNLHNFIVDHSVFKILHGCENMMDELGKLLDAKIIFLLRHPIPVSLSRKELPRLKSFIENDNFAITETQKKFSKSIFLNGSNIEKSVLDWCFQNTLALRNKNSNWMTITYEQMVLNPKPIIEELEKRRIINNSNEIGKSLTKLSLTTSQSEDERKYLLEDKNKNAIKIITKWVDKVDEKQISQVQRVLDVFEIDVYKANSPFPNTNF